MESKRSKSERPFRPPTPEKSWYGYCSRLYSRKVGHYVLFTSESLPKKLKSPKAEIVLGDFGDVLALYFNSLLV